MINCARLAAILERLAKAAEGPYQRGRFVDHSRYRTTTSEQKLAWQKREERTLRGPGEVGTPGCNVVAVFDDVDPNTMALFQHCYEDMYWLVARLNSVLETNDILRRENDDLRLQHLRRTTGDPGTSQ